MAYLPQSGSTSSSPEAQLKSLPVILLALMGGMVSFAGLATYMAMTRGALMVPAKQDASAAGAGAAAGFGGGAGDPTLVLYVVSGVLTAISIVISIGLGRYAVSSVRKSWASGDDAARKRQATAALFTTSILRGGFAEGAGLFGAVVVLLTGTLYTLGAVVIAAVLLAMLVPVRTRLEALLADAAR